MLRDWGLTERPMTIGDSPASGLNRVPRRALIVVWVMPKISICPGLVA